MYVIGIDLGGTNTKIALIKDGARIIDRRQFPTKAYKNKNGLISAISDNINSIISENHLERTQISGIGVGAPGLVNSKNGIVHCLTNIPGWKNVNLKKLLQGKTGFGIYVDNDVNLMALAEFRFGAGKGARNLFCITLGTGVGGGIVIDGKLYRGNTMSAGEIGHVSINPYGPQCKCGNRGCVEAYVGNSYIVKRAIQHIKKGFPSILKNLVGGKLNKITPEVITKAAIKGDKLARKIWGETAEYLAAALIMVVNVLDPHVIVIGGGLTGAGKFLFGPLRKLVKSGAIEVSGKAVRIVKAKLGNDAGVIGAAELVHNCANKK